MPNDYYESCPDCDGLNLDVKAIDDTDRILVTCFDCGSQWEDYL